MGYYISSMIGIRTGGVFGGETDVENMRSRIAKLVLEMRKESHFELGQEPPTEWEPPDMGDENGNPSHCMSKELKAHKGSYVVLAGVFNYWNVESVGEFCRRLSKEFGTDVMQMTWAEQSEQAVCCVWTGGEIMGGEAENPIGKILRRVT